MADVKITALAALLGVAPEDILAIVDDPAGAAVTKKVTVEQLFTASGASVKLSSAQSIPTLTTTAVSFSGTEDYDTDAYHDSGTNPSRFTAPTDGLYLITGALEWAASSAGRRFAIIRLNGTTQIASDGRPPFSVGGTFHTIVRSTRLTAGDYVELCGFQDSGGSLNAQSSSAVTYLSIARLGF